MIKIDHTTLAKDPTLGYYEIGSQVYWDKASALMAGTRQNLGWSDIHWNFNDIEFGQFDWAIEPPGNIRDYYHARARQLREKYDYLILNCSGGGDSTTMLYAFINQGLHVDEIFVRHATAGTNKYNATNKIFDPSNEFSEFEYAALPLIKWLEKVSPRTKITVHDFSLDIINDTLTWDENFIHWCGDYVTPGCIVRYSHASQKDSLNTFDKGNSIGILFGTDKPRIIIDNDKVYTLFGDRQVSSVLPAAVNNGYTNTQVELFYWHPDALPLIAKQCHVVKRWIENPLNQGLRYMFNLQWLRSSVNRTAYELLVKGLIYPDYDTRTFQCDKPVKAIYQEWDYWMEGFKDSNGFKTFTRGLTHLQQNIGAQFLSVDRDALRQPGVPKGLSWEYAMYSSNKYCIGDLNIL
jgi:hypothetical protein